MSRRSAIFVVSLASANFLMGGAPVWAGPSVYLTAPDDPAAVTVDGKAVTVALPAWATYVFGETAPED